MMTVKVGEVIVEVLKHEQGPTEDQGETTFKITHCILFF